MHSADRVLPEFQHAKLGETIDFGANRMRLERAETEHVLAWRSEKERKMLLGIKTRAEQHASTGSWAASTPAFNPAP